MRCVSMTVNHYIIFFGLPLLNQVDVCGHTMVHESKAVLLVTESLALCLRVTATFNNAAPFKTVCRYKTPSRTPRPVCCFNKSRLRSCAGPLNYHEKVIEMANQI